MKDSPNLDALRSCAVGLVLLSHAPDFMDGMQWDFNYKTLGRIGVALFFVHTTLVLLLSLERHGAAAGAFFARRFFRIYPLAIAAVVCMAVLLWLGGRPLEWRVVLANLLLVQNITGHRSYPDPLWTLPYEVQMYLLLPILFGVMCSPVALRRLACIYAAALAVAALAGALSIATYWFGFIPCFLPGAVAFVLRKRVTSALHPAALFAVIAIASVMIPGLVARGLPELPLFWVLCLAVGIMIALCREITAPGMSVAAHQVAKHSYGIYLTHVLAMGMTMMGSEPWYLRVAMFAVVQAAFARAAYLWIEAPGMKLGERLAARLQEASRPSRTQRA